MAGMTKLQKKYIEDIESVLKVEYTGSNSRKYADLFIKKYRDKHQKYKLEKGKRFPPTGKQKRFIKEIEETLDIKFTGRTVNTASKFISENIGDFNLFKSNDQTMKHRLNMLSKKIEVQVEEKKRRLVNE